MIFKKYSRRKIQKDRELAPDEIFLDSTNLPSFNANRLEGRIERPMEENTYGTILAFIILALLILVGQAASLQIVQGDAFATRSEKNRLRPVTLFATRGPIEDRNGVPLVTNNVIATSTTNGAAYATRTYPSFGYSHLLGYVSYPKKDSSGNFYETRVQGKAGVEAAFDEQLAGTNGQLLVEEDALGNVTSQGKTVAEADGKPLMLSIDSRVQDAFASSIKELANKIPFDGGSGVVINIETGEVIALVSYPEYDSNVLSGGTPRATIASYQTDKRLPYLDRAVSGLYTPGSIVKTIVGAGALDDNIVTPDTVIVSTGSLKLPNPYDPSKPTIFPDWKILGPMTMRSAIAMSSDVYFYTVGGGFGAQKGLGIDLIHYWYDLFGFESPTGIELKGEKTGFVPTPEWKKSTFNEDWNIGDTYHTSIGQYAMQITPLEAVRAIAAIANDGKLLQLTLQKDPSPVGQSIPIDHNALKVIREGMHQGVTSGTAQGLNVSYTSVSAKTGTAQLGYAKQYVNSWAVGFFPYEKPKYAFAVVMEKGPQTNLVGGVYVVVTALNKIHQTAPEFFSI